MGRGDHTENPSPPSPRESFKPQNCHVTRAHSIKPAGVFRQHVFHTSIDRKYVFVQPQTLHGPRNGPGVVLSAIGGSIDRQGCASLSGLGRSGQGGCADQARGVNVGIHVVSGNLCFKTMFDGE